MSSNREKFSREINFLNEIAYDQALYKKFLNLKRAEDVVRLAGKKGYQINFDNLIYLINHYQDGVDDMKTFTANAGLVNIQK